MRRLSITRSLINQPDLLLLDEPTTGLDPQARHVIWERLYRLKHDGVTLIITTHYMDEAEQLCDRLVVMDGGKIVATGSPRSLIDEHSTREVLEVRFTPNGDGAPRRASMSGIGARVEVLPDRTLVYADDGEAALAAVHAGVAADELAGAPVEPRRRVLAPDRANVGGLAMAMATPGPVRVAVWHATVFRRFWVTNVLASFVQPLLYLLGLGVGVGALVDRTARSTRCSAGVVRRVHRARLDGHHGDGVGGGGEHVADHGWVHLEPRVSRDRRDTTRPGRHRRRPRPVDGDSLPGRQRRGRSGARCCFPEPGRGGCSRRFRSRP